MVAFWEPAFEHRLQANILSLVELFLYKEYSRTGYKQQPKIDPRFTFACIGYVPSGPLGSYPDVLVFF